jgi:hypothetical protein
MSIMVGGDFYSISGLRAPKGLVSDPPNYSACQVAMGAFVPRPAKRRLAKPTQAELTGKCQQLYQGIKEQALTYLIESRWTIDLGVERGLKVTDAEVMRLRASYFPTEAMFQKYVSDREWTPSAELLDLKRSLILSKLKEKLGKTGGEQAVASAIAQATTKWTARTICRNGYEVEQCSNYKAATGAARSPAVLIEELAGKG